MRDSKNKAQVKFGETIGIIFIVYIIIILGVNWYSSLNEDDILELQDERNQLSANEMYDFIVSTPKLRKSESTDTKNIMDLQSLLSFYNFTKTDEGKDFLRKRLGEGIITMYLYELDENGEVQIFDLNQNSIISKDDDSLVLYNNTRPGLEPRSILPIRTTYPVELTYTDKLLIGVITTAHYIYQ